MVELHKILDEYEKQIQESTYKLGKFKRESKLSRKHISTHKDYLKWANDQFQAQIALGCDSIFPYSTVVEPKCVISTLGSDQKLNNNQEFDSSVGKSMLAAQQIDNLLDGYSKLKPFPTKTEVTRLFQEDLSINISASSMSKLICSSSLSRHRKVNSSTNSSKSL